MRRYAAAAAVLLLAPLVVCVAWGAEHTLAFRVVDARSQQPVEGVMLKLTGSCNGAVVNGGFRTDTAGKADLKLASNEVLYLSVSSTKDGYVPMRVSWPARGNDNAGARLLPADYALAIEPATTIGGRVLDDASQPIGGATVVLHVRGKPDAARPNETVNVIYETVKTDATGKWSYTGVPAAFAEINLGTYHTDYNSSGGNGYYPMRKFDTVGKLRDGTAVLTIPRGVPIEGVVLSADGKPLMDARVGMGQDRVASNSFPEAVTDENGRFRMAADAGATVPLTAMAAGYAPDLKRVVLSKGKATVEFSLGPAKTLKGRVVDVEGKPLPGAYLYVDTWRGCRTLDTHITTDAAGRFAWHDAPTDEVQVDVVLLGYADVRDMPMTASDEEITVTLRPPLKVTGAVVDADSGQPVDTFSVIRGDAMGDGRVYWERESGRSLGHAGTFAYELSYPRPGYAVRIEADGYLPADSRTFRMEEGNVKLEFRLTKGKGLSGVVKDKDGKPVVGAKVALATKEAGAYIRNGAELEDQGAARADTDAAGRYSFPPQGGAFTAVAFAAAGYAEVPRDQLARQPDITLTPWGRIEGTVRVGGKPGAGSEISLREHRQYDGNAPQVLNYVQTVADADGKFVCDRVRPGEVTVARRQLVPIGNGTSASATTHQARATVKPGETTTVALGGLGRPVVGRVAIPPAVAAKPQWVLSTSQIATKTERPKLPIPEGLEREKQAEWRANFIKTEAGNMYQAALEAARQSDRQYTLVLQGDGSFRADDVEPGTYEVRVDISEPQDGGGRIVLATVSTTVTIDPIPGGYSDEPLDLGTLPMELSQRGAEAGRAKGDGQRQ